MWGGGAEQMGGGGSKLIEASQTCFESTLKKKNVEMVCAGQVTKLCCISALLVTVFIY